MSEWREVKISDIADVIGGGTPKTPVAEYWNGDIPWLSVVDFNTGKKYVSKTEKTITNLGLKKSSTKLLQTNDIIISARETVGALAMLDKPMAFNQSCYGMRAKEEITTSDYLFYLLINTVRQLQQASYGAVFDTITRNTFDETNISLPPLKEQKAIAEVLSSLDDKIDLLHRQNKTLEALAQTIFREWFIEEAKNEWEEYEIKDFATHKKVSIKPAQNKNDTFLHFSLPAFDTNKEPLIELGSDIKSNKYQVEPFSILMSKLNPKTPRVWDIYFEPEDNSICSTEFQVVQPNDKDFFSFISTLLKSDKVKNNLAMSASGTSGSHQRVKPEDIFSISFLAPSVDKIKEFSKILEPNYLKQRKNQQQIKTLENLRDTLLPKLMSGEVRVKYEL